MPDKKEFRSPELMLQWQWRSMIEELTELQRHLSDPSCPCILADSGEFCGPKHALGLHTLAKETIAMSPENSEMLETLAEEALDQHNALKDRIVCGHPHKDERDTVTWSRQWRKRIEDIYYHKACKIGKLKLKDSGDFLAEIIARLPARLNDSEIARTGYNVAVCSKCNTTDHHTEIIPNGDGTNHVIMTCAKCGGLIADSNGRLNDSDPHLKISGTCSPKEGCSIKVTGKVETIEQTTAANLPSAIDSVIKSMEKKQAKKATPDTYAIGSTSLKKYDLKFVIRDAKTLIPSNDPLTFEANPDYPQELQPRLRGRAANKSQVISIASNLDPVALTEDFHSLDRGAPIISAGGVVLSGNGRVMAILHAISEFPKSYALYKANLESKAGDYGLKVGKIENPVLVRELVSKVDEKQFVEEANASGTIQSSGIEVARSDAQKITPAMLNSLEIGDGQTIEDALRSNANSQFVASFLSKLTANDRASISDAKGNLSQDAIHRMVMAVFVNVFSGETGLSLAQRFYENTDIAAKNVFNGLIGALGKLAQADNLVKDGQRTAGLDIGDDLAKVVVVFSDLKKQDGMTVDKFLNQTAMFERVLNPFQELLLKEIDKRSRSGKKISALLKSYADIVIEQPPPSQGSFMAIDPLTKEQIFEAAIRRSSLVTVEDIIQLFDSGFGEISNFVNQPKAKYFKLYLVLNPAGTYSFLGTIPMGLIEPGKSHSRLFASKEAAWAAAKELGFEENKIYSKETGLEMSGVKEPWQMTAKEYQTNGKPNYGDMVTDGKVAGRLRSAGGLGSSRVIIEDKITGLKHYTNLQDVKLIRRLGVGSAVNDFNYDLFHKNIIKQALAEGKPVPPEVLADYPELLKPRENMPEIMPEKNQIETMPSGQSMFTGAGQGRLMDSLFSGWDYLKGRLDVCNLDGADSDAVMNYPPLRDFIMAGIGAKSKVRVCHSGFVPGAFQVTIEDMTDKQKKDIALKIGNAIPGAKQIHTRDDSLVYQVLIPASGPSEMKWESQEVNRERRKEAAEQAALFDSDPVKADLKRSIHEELKTSEAYLERSKNADPDTAALYLEIRKDELTHYDALTKRLAKLKGTALNDAMLRSDPVNGETASVDIPLSCGRKPVEPHIRKAIENAEEVD